TVPQPPHREGARPRGPADSRRPRRRADRMMKRREFITLLGGAASWPLAAGAQEGGRGRGVWGLLNLTADDAGGQGRLPGFPGGRRGGGGGGRRHCGGRPSRGRG